jgi:hypothetical protein
MHHERDVGEIEREDEALQIVDMILQPIAARRWRLAFAKAHVVGHDHAMGPAEGRDQVAKQIAPGRLAMQAQHDLVVTWPLVEIMHAEGRRRGEVRRE